MSNIFDPAVRLHNSEPITYLVFNDGGPYTNPALTLGNIILNSGANNVTIPFAGILTGGTGAISYASATPVKKKYTVTPAAKVTTTMETYSLVLETPGVHGRSGKLYRIDLDNAQTATQMSTQFIALINADANSPVVAAAVGATFTVESKVAGQSIYINSFTTNIGVVTTTANVKSAGQTADLIATGVASALIDTSAAYQTVIISYQAIVAETDGTRANDTMKNVVYIFIQEGGAAEADVWTNGLSDMLDGTTAGDQYLDRIA